MNRLMQCMTVVVLLALAVSSCGPSAVAPTATPTTAPPTAPPPTKPPTTETPKPRSTATPTGIPPTPTAAPTTTPALPSTFDMMLNATNGTCGSGDAQHPYTFTIAGSTLSLLQVDADITTTGPYDSATGAFNTSAQVGPGTEYYTGTITFDGTLITVTGESSYVQAGLCVFIHAISGQTTVP